MDSLVRPRTASPHSPPIKHARSLSPRSVMVEYDFSDNEASNDSRELPHLQQSVDNFDYDCFFRSGASPTHRPNKRKLPPANLSPRSVVNLRNRQVSNETVQWLSDYDSLTHPVSDTDDNDYSYEPLPCRTLYSDPREETVSYAIREPVEELWLGPVFESSQTVLTSITSLPVSVTHLDLDLRNALHLLPQAMPLLFRKHHLKTLSLRIFGDAGVVELSKWMNENPNLEKLDLRGNRIGSTGARMIFDAILQGGENNPQHSLKDLNLSCNCILQGDRIGDLLESNARLEVLDLGYNWLGNEDVEEICRGLSKNQSLRELNLFGCHRISYKGMKSILRCLKKHNTSLHKIGLQAFDEEGKRLIEEINHWLKLNKAGRYLIKSSLASPLASMEQQGACQPKKETVPTGLWSHVLHKSNSDPESMFHLLREGFGSRILNQH